LEPVVAAHPKLLGIGIDPHTIIVVQGDQFAVIGRSRVHDNRGGPPTICNSVWQSLRPAKTETAVTCLLTYFTAESGDFCCRRHWKIVGWAERKAENTHWNKAQQAQLPAPRATAEW
jgi:hypothetical protein